MKIFAILMGLLFYCLTAYATKTNIVCEEAKGQGVYYFTSNNGKAKNNTFLPHEDSTSATLVIKINPDNTSMLIFSDAQNENKSFFTTELIPILASPEQVSLVGILNGAPILITFYPEQGIVIYSIQSNWGSYANGARATLMYSHCRTNVE